MILAYNSSPAARFARRAANPRSSQWFVDNVYKKSKRWEGGSESESSVESRSSEDWEDEGAAWESDDDGRDY